MTFSPFPEREILRLAEEYDETAQRFGEGSKMRAFYAARAAMLKNSVDQHGQLRDRFLEQSMLVRKLEAERTEKVA